MCKIARSQDKTKIEKQKLNYEVEISNILEPEKRRKK